TAPNYKKTEEGTESGKTARPGLEPFDAPTLAELEAKVEWEPQPVVDIMERSREFFAGIPQKTTAEEALKLRNNSSADNERILDGLGRPPKSESDVNTDAEINRHLSGDINSTNPLLSSSVSDADVNGLTGIGFFSFDWNMEPFAPVETVVSWHTSKDKLYDKLVIRKDLTWSDGKPVTAHDVVFSFQTIMNPEVPVPAVRQGTDQIRWIEAYDDHTFVIFHKEALSTNVWNCNFPIIPKHIYEESVKEDPKLVDSPYHQKLELNAVTGGQYKVLRRVKGQEVILERRESWYMHEGKQVRPKPNYRLIRFRVIEDNNTARLALNDGKLDEMEMQPRQWVEQTNDDAFYRLNTKVRGPQWVYYYFGWNIKTPYFSDVRVRKAMSYATNYEQILGKLCYGLYEQSLGLFPREAWMASQKERTPYKQDLAKAEQLLTEAGWVDTDGDGIRDKVINGQKVKFEFSIMCVNDQTRIDISTSLAESLGQLGIQCHVKPTEFTVMQQLAQDHKFQAMFGGWGTGTDPDTAANLWKTGESRNYLQYSNSKVDELFRKAQLELNQEKRAEYYAEIDDILWEDQPYTWLYTRSAFYAFNRKLRGYKFSPRGPFNYSPGFGSIWTVQP
ncbi:MAG TPA: ABC transporter substrate-binding protein, partial [Planctomicrobium sp.]|nr:ABC transporter substrate-binding protein [Planctomicrobium sp.]